IAVALTKTPPVDSQTGAAIDEIENAGSYARVNLGAPAKSDWDAPSNGTTQNTEAIIFPQATDNWGWASGFAILDSATYGAGNVLVYATLKTPREIQNTYIYTLASGNLDISVA